MKPTILFLFNSSEYAVQPWLDCGLYNCVSVDHEDTDHSGEHRPLETSQGHTRLNVDLGSRGAYIDIMLLLSEHKLLLPSFILSFASCTDLAVSGAAHFEKKRKLDPLFQHKATQAAKLVLKWDCPSIVENPVSVLATTWRKPTGYVHPWQFSYLLPHDDVHPEFPEVFPAGDWYNKKTGLWCSNGARMPQTDRAAIRGPSTDFPGHVKLGGKSARTKYIRSLTPRGLARAIYLANAPHMTTHEQQLELEL
jgi:hypothetical protein